MNRPLGDPGEEADGQPAYSLGHSDRELTRLRVQARLVNPITRRFLVEAGIAPGMRVLDIGSGVGDVAFLAAGLVGDAGEVVGTDRSAAALAVARERVEQQSLRTVTFRDGDPAQMTFEHPFDAIVGRYVLMHQPDPTAMLRNVAAHARTGGVIVFHEPYRDNIRSYPAVTAYDHAWELVSETTRRSGADPLMGIKLHATFVAAGLPAPSMRMESVIAGGATSSDQVHYEMDLVGSLASEMERLGVAKASDLDADTLAGRVLEEAIATDSVIIGRSEIGAWSSIDS
jgi:SAM-dependent methyltransferase